LFDNNNVVGSDDGGVDDEDKGVVALSINTY
jgi:hypothetical protein